MKQPKRTKKRSAPSKSSSKVGGVNGCSERNAQKAAVGLVEKSSSASLEEVSLVNEQAVVDADKEAEILSGSSENSEDPTESSSSSFFMGSSSGSSDGFNEPYCATKGVRFRSPKGNKGKKMFAATGTVSTVLGKDYVPASSRKESKNRKGLGGGKVDAEEMEQFLCSMLGDDCELSMAVVKDVLCQCGYNVDKALDILLDLSGSSSEPVGSDTYSSLSGSSEEDAKCTDFIYEDNFWQPTGASDSTSHSSENELQDNAWPMNYGYRSYSEAITGSNSSGSRSYSDMRSNDIELPHEVLGSLFNIPRHPSVHEPSTMNWRNVVKKMESFAQKRIELCPSGTSSLRQNTNVKGAEYGEYRGPARNHWDSMKANYEKASVAYTNGSKAHAAYLSDKAKMCGKKAQEADEKASMEIFKVRNKDMGNVLTIDLHGQHVKSAMRLVKLHILFGTHISSVQFIRIITGCGSHGLGKSKLKQSVVNLLKNEGIVWREENQGMILIKLEGPREFTFLDSESDSE